MKSNYNDKGELTLDGLLNIISAAIVKFSKNIYQHFVKMIKINGVEISNLSGGKYQFDVSGKQKYQSVVIKNNRIVVNGQDVTPGGEDTKVFNIEIVGDVDYFEVTHAEKVNVTGKANTVRTLSGDVYCGDVDETVNTQSGNVECGNVGAGVSTMSGDVKAKVINGNVKTMSGSIRL